MVMETETLQSLLEQAIKVTSNEQEAVGAFVTMFAMKQATEIESTKEAARKLGEGLKKYRTAHNNLKAALQAVDE